MAQNTTTASDRDVEALAADENSPLLTMDSEEHETVEAKALRFKCVYTPSLSSDSATTASEDSPKISQTKQNVATMICLLLIGMTFLHIFLVARSSTHVSAPLHLRPWRLAQLSFPHSRTNHLTSTQGLSSPAPTATSLTQPTLSSPLPSRPSPTPPSSQHPTS